MLDIFALRNQIIDDYHRYIDSFLNIRDRKVKAFVDGELAKGELWQNPLIQLNPAYQRGESISELDEICCVSGLQQPCLPKEIGSILEGQYKTTNDRFVENAVKIIMWSNSIAIEN